MTTDPAQRHGGPDAGRWACPNSECLHSGLVHDIESFEDPKPMCCVEGCDCGKAP